MNVEERVRAATRARADLVRDVGPLRLLDDVAEFRPTGPRRTRPRSAWLTPLAAAALVVAVVLVQLVIRQSVGPQAASRPAAPASVPASVPRYYVALSNPVASASGVSVMSNRVIVGDDRAGRSLTAVAAPAGQYFTGVTSAADDRTFYLSSYQVSLRATVWYQLRITPGAAHPARLTRLPIKPLAAAPHGLAVSQDGRTLAVMTTAKLPKFAQTLTLRDYSVRSGAVLGQWTTVDDSGWFADNVNDYNLAWSADGQHVTFKYYVTSNKPDKALLVQARTLDVTAAGNDLIADSRVDLQLPATLIKDNATVTLTPCVTLQATSDGGGVVCGAFSSGSAETPVTCHYAPATIINYPAATGGKPAKLLYQYASPCWSATTIPLWTGSTTRAILGLLEVTPAHGHTLSEFGLFANGRFTPLADALALSPSASGIINVPGVIAF